MAGRPNKPNHIKKAEGTLRKDRVLENSLKHDLLVTIPKKNELSILDTDILNDEGKEYFNLICGEMIKLGILSKVYMIDIHNAAFNQQTIMIAQRQLKNSYTVKFSTGCEQISAWVSIKEKAEKAFNDFSNRYGLNLAASQKISVQDIDTDKLDE